MDTEQLKTAEEILKQQMIKLLKKEQPEWTDKEVEEMVDQDLASEPEFVDHFIESMQIFASQESKLAVEKDRESRWISVKTPPELTEQVFWYNDDNERVPWEGKFERHVLAICSKKGIIKARYDGAQWVEISSFGSSSIVNITLWQPLPQAPKV